MANAVVQHFINGRRHPSSGRDTFEVRSPYDGHLVGVVAAANRADADKAVKAARTAFDQGPWSLMTPKERLKAVSYFCRLHAERAREFAAFITEENGSPTWFTQAVQQGIAPQNQAFLNVAEGYPWEERTASLPHGTSLRRREAVGVVAAVIPWNAPHQSALVKVIPALLAGCCVVLKLAPETGLDGHLLGELANEAGVSPGALNIITADRDVSEHLIGHPDVDKVAFTGSTAAGIRIAQIAGRTLKRVSLELGGKSAAIVLADADLEHCAAALKGSGFANNGQSCNALTRVLVPASLQDRFTEALVVQVRKMVVGDPLDPDTFVSTLVASRQQERVWQYIRSGMDEGATLSIGGLGMPEGQTRGPFVKPTIFSNVDNRMRIAREEIFGPVISVIPYRDVDDAITIANDSEYGLSGAVMTADASAGIDVARRIRTGTFSVNGAGPDFLSPFGGFKQSGIGREFGEIGLDEYIEHKTIHL